MAVVTVYAHDSGQRFNWAYSREAVVNDRQQWLDLIAEYNHMPRECVGPVIECLLRDIGEEDEYVG